ncbi:DNA internalization-related competence protein ComEC/Rec2 [Sporomusa acidovorans]|uniref:ComE operon protein 3 n=1 Tax=Sporomusa acidovorans (strain ATCC 49682 / DSM 3132 / Mol) TaxID=1123286 RepID=A0ABZ3J477_SPOA4|nr:DNA internalization-related competence protein ComEC/Rec2 [Sporomusa acidovorans]OZC23101.1 ComEC family competence protein [Sporomusa acidovorans DSM 3132]SDF05556.1 competence protein ComEC [Sporomusa acidovorans]
MALNHIVLAACAAFAAGIWLAELTSWHLPLLIILVILLLITAARRIAGNSEQSFWSITGLFFMAGMLCYYQAVTIRSDDISQYADKTAVVEGTIDNVPEVIQLDEQKKLVRYILKAEKVKSEKAEQTVMVSGKLRVTIQYKRAKANPAALGDKVAVNGKVLNLHRYNNPGQIDLTAAPKRQGITARMNGQEESVRLLATSPNYSWQAALAKWRDGMITGLKKVMPANDAAILTAVLFGGYRGIDKSVITDFTATGLIHILSVSGAHIALVAGMIRWFGKRLRWGPVLTLSLAALVIILYACMSGLTPPVIRSALMGLISLLAVLLERDNYTPVALAGTALGMLIYQPLLLFDISFQLSFGATAGLVFLYQRTTGYLSQWPSWLAGPCAVTLAAQLGVMPVIAWYFNNFSLISFVANIVVLPVAEWVIILGLAGVIIYTVVPVVGSIVFVFCSLLIGFVMMLTSLLAAVPYSSVYIPSVGIAGSAIYYSLLAWMYGWRPFHLPGPGKMIKEWPYATAFTVMLLICVIIVYNCYPKPLTVHFIDVGQGDAILIVTPHGRTALVDTGGTMGDTDFDIGERVVVPYLKHYGVTGLDYLILTHGHQDHAGGAAGIAGSIRVAAVLLPQEEHSQAVQALLHTKPAVAVIPTYTGQKIRLDGVIIRIDQAVGEHTENGHAPRGNEVSSVIRVSYGEHSFLLTGDLEAQGEAALLAKNVAPCTVLKVGHHGSRTSTTEPFLQAVTPEFAVISAGYGNRFGHPHSETIQRLAARKIEIYRTDRQGAIVFCSDGKTMTVDTYIK